MGIIKEKGIHATIKEYKKDIIDKGFCLKKIGRLGGGIYFWIGIHMETLGICWYKYCLAIGRYKNSSNARGILIYVKIKTDDKHYLDTEDLELKKRIHILIKEKNIKDFKSLSFLYDKFIEICEKKSGVKIKLIRGKVAPPKDCKEYNIKIYGAPDCLVVREPSIIKITKIEDIINE